MFFYEEKINFNYSKIRTSPPVTNQDFPRAPKVAMGTNCSGSGLYKGIKRFLLLRRLFFQDLLSFKKPHILTFMAPGP